MKEYDDLVPFKIKYIDLDHLKWVEINGVSRISNF